MFAHICCLSNNATLFYTKFNLLRETNEPIKFLVTLGFPRWRHYEKGLLQGIVIENVSLNTQIKDTVIL